MDSQHLPSLALLMHFKQRAKSEIDGVPGDTDFPTDRADLRRYSANANRKHTSEQH
jgi:hypothetical protein